MENDIRKVSRGELEADITKLQAEIKKLEETASNKIKGKMIVAGMKKEGNQSHIHIIVSRKDVTNTFSLSPASRYKASEVEMHGRKVQRGFLRDQFYEKSEKIFNKLFNYN